MHMLSARNSDNDSIKRTLWRCSLEKVDRIGAGMNEQATFASDTPSTEKCFSSLLSRISDEGSNLAGMKLPTSY